VCLYVHHHLWDGHVGEAGVQWGQVGEEEVHGHVQVAVCDKGQDDGQWPGTWKGRACIRKVVYLKIPEEEILKLGYSFMIPSTMRQPEKRKIIWLCFVPGSCNT
jgi:hypothetical protein